MPHHHDHSHAQQVKFDNGRRNVFLIGIGLNFLFVLAEIVGGLVYNSMALLTDAGHNASDVASLVLSLIAFWMAKKKSTPSFTYGYKKTTVLAALVNAIVLLIAIGILGFESVTRLFKPEDVNGTVVAWIAGAGILVNGISALLFYRHQKNELNAKSAYLHLMADALVSLGVVVAGIVMSYTNWYWIDPAIGLVIMVVILVSTWNLLRDSFRMTIDAVPTGIELQEVKDIILKVMHVHQVGHVHVWPLSTTENALTAHVVVDDALSFDKKLEVIEEIKHSLEHHNIQHSTIELQKNIE
jgi:cobalt-zinc-cadmium efflux system protein